MFEAFGSDGGGGGGGAVAYFLEGYGKIVRCECDWLKKIREYIL